MNFAQNRRFVKSSKANKALWKVRGIEMEKMPLVSIISPCYNGAKYLSQFLDSILAQTYSRVELILVNDASTDNSLEIVESYLPKFQERCFKLIIKTQSVNLGQAAAINMGLPIFTGEYLMWMDSDDILLPDALSEKVKFLECNPQYDFVINSGLIVNENDLNKTVGILKRKKPEGRDDLFSDLVYSRNVVFCPGTICVRSSAIRMAVPSLCIFESRVGQNWQLMLPLAYLCKYGYIDKPLFKYVVHSDSHSHQKRTFEDAIHRCENIEIMLNATLDRIQSMPTSEREKWKEKIKTIQLFDKLDLANEYRRRSDFNLYKHELKNNGISLSVFRAYDLYYLKKLYWIIKSKW